MNQRTNDFGYGLFCTATGTEESREQENSAPETWCIQTRAPIQAKDIPSAETNQLAYISEPRPGVGPSCSSPPHSPRTAPYTHTHTCTLCSSKEDDYEHNVQIGVGGGGEGAHKTGRTTHRPRSERASAQSAASDGGPLETAPPKFGQRPWLKGGADRGVSQRELFRSRHKQSTDRRRVAVSFLVANPLAYMSSHEAPRHGWPCQGLGEARLSDLPKRSRGAIAVRQCGGKRRNRHDVAGHRRSVATTKTTRLRCTAKSHGTTTSIQMAAHGNDPQLSQGGRKSVSGREAACGPPPSQSQPPLDRRQRSDVRPPPTLAGLKPPRLRKSPASLDMCLAGVNDRRFLHRATTEGDGQERAFSGTMPPFDDHLDHPPCRGSGPRLQI